MCLEMAACPCLFFSGNVLLLAQSLTIEEIEVLLVPNFHGVISLARSLSPSPHAPRPPHTQESDFEPPLAFSEIPCGGDQCLAALSCPLFCLVHTGLRSSIRKRYTRSQCNRCDDMSQRVAV